MYFLHMTVLLNYAIDFAIDFAALREYDSGFTGSFGGNWWF
jgi:hypothetical protein